jgi:glycosyltransferase 2 family protein
MLSRLKPWAVWMLKALITGGILWLIFSRIPIREVALALREATLSYVLLGVLFVLAMRYLGACQTKRLTDTQGMSLSVRQLFEISCATSFYSRFLPGVLAGGAIRWYKLSQPDQKPAQSLTVILYDRLLNTSLALVCGIAFWFLDRGTASFATIGIGLVSLLGGLLFIWLLIFQPLGSLQIWERVSHLLPLPGIVREKLRKVGEASRQYQRLSYGSLLTLLGLSFTRSLLGTLSLYSLALALEMEVSLFTVGWIRAVILVAGMLPVSFAGLGVREGISLVLLQPYGIPPTTAVAWGLLSLVGALVIAVIGAACEARQLRGMRATVAGV